MHNKSSIWRGAKQVLLLVEPWGRVFPHYHKYTLGTELRQQALLICTLVNKAWRDKAQHPQREAEATHHHRIVLHQGVNACITQ